MCFKQQDTFPALDFALDFTIQANPRAASINQSNPLGVIPPLGHIQIHQSHLISPDRLSTTSIPQMVATA
jgi:hypothetical protein